MVRTNPKVGYPRTRFLYQFFGHNKKTSRYVCVSRNNILHYTVIKYKSPCKLLAFLSSREKGRGFAQEHSFCKQRNKQFNCFPIILRIVRHEGYIMSICEHFG